MIRLSISSSLINRPITGISKVLTLYHNRLKALWIQSTRQFILAAIERIPIDTGMSRASFQPLAVDIRFKTILRSLLRGNKGPKLSYDYQPGVKKSIDYGIELGQDAYKIDLGTRDNPSMLFEFRIVVFQHRIHEYAALDGPPWRSLDVGREAFINFWRGNFNSIVKPEDILSRLVRGS